MKVKIICILVMTLLIATILPISADNVNNDMIRKIANKSLSNERWIKHFPGTSWAHVVRETNDGYVLIGATDTDISGDGLVIKVDFFGNEIWNKTFPSSAFEGLYITNNNSYIISGWKVLSTTILGYLIELDESGNVKWQKTYGAPGPCQLIQVTQTCDGGYASSGFSEVNGSNDAWVVKTDENGNVEWSKTYGLEDSDQTFHSIFETSDCGFILPGWTSIPPDQGIFKMGADGWVVKTNATGEVEWQQYYDTGESIIGIDKVDNINMGRQDSDGGYIFTGWSNATFFVDKGAFWFLKTDENGMILWEKLYGKGWFHDLGLWIEPTSDGGYIAAGKSNGIGTLLNIIQRGIYMPIRCNLWVIKTDSEGNILWDVTYRDATARCVQETTDGGYIIAGHKGPYYGTKGVLLIKTDENGIYNLEYE